MNLEPEGIDENKRVTLLLVDDEINVLRSLKRLLAETEVDIITANSAEQALESFPQNDIQLVISDFRMPGMDGVELLKHIRQMAPDTVRIILSGYADAAVMMEAINDGQIYKFIPKPWNDQDLLTTVSTAIEKHHLQRENTELYSELSQKYIELQEMTKTLEQKVAERTRDLETKNRALAVAQNILNYLPVGVIGVDSTGTIVYMNKALDDLIDTSRIQLGATIESAFDKDVIGIFYQADEANETRTIRLANGINLICKPLPDAVGVIGLFIDSLNCRGSKNDNLKKAGRYD